MHLHTSTPRDAEPRQLPRLTHDATSQSMSTPVTSTSTSESSPKLIPDDKVLPALQSHLPSPPPLTSDIDLEKAIAVTNPTPPILPTDGPNKDLVEFSGPADLGNPKNWSYRKRWAITISMGLMTFVVTFSSSIFSVAIEPVSQEYHCSTVVATLGVSLFLLGFVTGPIMFGPASEVFGRRTPLFAGYIAFAVFQIPVAVARNLETIMLGRFLSGFAAAAPLAIVGGALADIWGPVDRAYGVCAFAFAAFAGPVSFFCVFCIDASASVSPIVFDSILLHWGELTGIL